MKVWNRLKSVREMEQTKVCPAPSERNYEKNIVRRIHDHGLSFHFDLFIRRAGAAEEKQEIETRIEAPRRGRSARPSLLDQRNSQGDCHAALLRCVRLVRVQGRTGWHSIPGRTGDQAHVEEGRAEACRKSRRRRQSDQPDRGFAALAERRSPAEGGLPRAFQLQLAALPLRPAARPVDSHHRQSREADLERRGGKQRRQRSRQHQSPWRSGTVRSQERSEDRKGLRDRIWLSICNNRTPPTTAAPPAICIGSIFSPSHTHATEVATTGSSIEVRELLLASRCRRLAE